MSLTKAVTCDLEVPAEADFVIEGYIDPAEPLVTEGPFGDHTGFYSLADLYPQVHVTAITMRRDADSSDDDRRASADGRLLSRARHRTNLSSAAEADDPRDRRLSHAGGRNLSQPGLRLDQEGVSGQAYKVMNATVGTGADVAGQGAGRSSTTGSNVRNPQEAWWVALNNIDPERDARFTMGPVDVLDHSSRAFTYGSKMGLDATRKFPEEGFVREWPGVIEMDDATKRQGRRDVDVARHSGRRAMSDVTPPESREGQTFAHRGSRWLVYANFVKLAAHAVRAAVRAGRRGAGVVSRAGVVVA